MDDPLWYEESMVWRVGKVNIGCGRYLRHI